MNDTNVIDRWPPVDARKDLAVTGAVAHAMARWVPRRYARDKSKFFGIPKPSTVMRTKKPFKTTLFIDASLYSSSKGTWMQGCHADDNRRMDGRTMATGASVTWTHCSVFFEVTWDKTLASARMGNIQAMDAKGLHKGSSNIPFLLPSLPLPREATVCLVHFVV
jgi:hypothetical protein